MGPSPTFRIPHELLTFRFVELLTRTPTPRPLRSSPWGYGFFADPSPSSSGDCTMPTTLGITNPGTPNSHRVQALTDPASVPCPRPPGVPNPQVAGSRGVQALTDPASVTYPEPLASPFLKLQVPVRSEPSQVRRLHHAHNPRHHQSSRCAGSRGFQALAAPASAPSPRPLAFPILGLMTSVGSEPRKIHRPRHTHDPWLPQTS